MKNADMPAMPQSYELWCEGIGDCPTLATGLTKREMFAIHAMNGLIASGHMTNAEKIVKTAVNAADTLLAELEKTNEQP